MSLIAVIRKDPIYIKFKEILTVTQKKVDPEKMQTEALGLHASRISRSMSGDARYSSKRIADANFIEMRCRGRLVEIRVTADKHLGHLRKAMDAMRHHIVTEYVDDLSDYKTADQRKAVIERVLKMPNQFLAECDSSLSTLDYLIKDIDQSSHSMRHIVDTLKLLATKRPEL